MNKLYKGQTEKCESACTKKSSSFYLAADQGLVFSSTVKRYNSTNGDEIFFTFSIMFRSMSARNSFSSKSFNEFKETLYSTIIVHRLMIKYVPSELLSIS